MYIISKRSLALLALPAATALTAGCDGASTSPATPHAADGRVATIGLRSDVGLGRIRVDPHGRTLYLFRRDAQGRSVCAGACAVAWPPLRDRAAPLAGTGLRPSLVAESGDPTVGRRSPTTGTHSICSEETNRRARRVARVSAPSAGCGMRCQAPAAP
jgi:predicted lipoprotein with Yx(FWY)xxD motif